MFYQHHCFCHFNYLALMFAIIYSFREPVPAKLSYFSFNLNYGRKQYRWANSNHSLKNNSQEEVTDSNRFVFSKYRFQIVFVCHPGPKLGNGGLPRNHLPGPRRPIFSKHRVKTPPKKVFTPSDVFSKVITWNCYSKVTVKHISTIEKIFHTFYPLLVFV